MSTLDQCLADFDLIKFFRTHHGVESKTGKVPEAKFGDMDMKNPSKNHVIMRVDKMSKQFKQDEDGFTVSWRGAKPMTAKNLKRLARALYKIGLELICLDHGSSFALSSRFDETREIVLGKKDFEGYRLVGVNEVSVDPGVILLDEERK